MPDFLIKAWFNFWYVIVSIMNRVKRGLKPDRKRGIKD